MVVFVCVLYIYIYVCVSLYMSIIMVLMVHVLKWHVFGGVYDSRSVYCLCFHCEECAGIF